MKIKLGSEAQDSITGFVGVVVCISEWLNGCKRVSIQAKGLLEGKPIAQQTFDIEQLQFVAAAPERLSPLQANPSGGPHDPPTRNADPR